MGTFASVPQLSSSEQTDHSRQTDVSLATFPVSHGHEVCVFHHRPFVTDLCKCGNHSVVLSFLKCTECVIVFHLPFNFFFFLLIFQDLEFVVTARCVSSHSYIICTH